MIKVIIWSVIFVSLVGISLGVGYFYLENKNKLPIASEIQSLIKTKTSTSVDKSGTTAITENFTEEERSQHSDISGSVNVKFLEEVKSLTSSTTISANSRALSKIVYLESYPSKFSIKNEKAKFEEAALLAYNQLYNQYKNDLGVVEPGDVRFMKSRLIYGLNSLYNLTCSNAELFYKSDWIKDSSFNGLNVQVKNQSVSRQLSVQYYIYKLMSISDREYRDRDTFTFLANRSRTLLWNFSDEISQADKKIMSDIVMLGTNRSYTDTLRVRPGKYPISKQELGYLYSVYNNNFYLYINGQNKDFNYLVEYEKMNDLFEQFFPERNALYMIYKNSLDFDLAIELMNQYEKAVVAKYPVKEPKEKFDSLMSQIVENNKAYIQKNDATMNEVYGTYLSSLNNENGKWNIMKNDYLRLAKYSPGFADVLRHYGVVVK